MSLSPTVRHLYIHVPFCPSICPYCDFHVLTRQAGAVEKYLERLDIQAAELAQNYDVQLETVYLGGGTPSFLRDSELEHLVSSVRTHLGWGTLENTLEVNPGTVSLARAAHWKNLGLDRASVGVQSLDDATLKFLGRQHDAQTARDAVITLVNAGFRVSGDLITAVKNQPLERDIFELVNLGVEHISAYTLTIEEGTPFARAGIEVLEADELRGFEVTAQLLSELGFERYEVSNYARGPLARSKHNLSYWGNQFYLGLGPGAAGHYPAPSSPEPQSSADVLALRYTQPHLYSWLEGESPKLEQISPEEYVTDALFMGLRLTDGVDLVGLGARAGVDILERFGAVIWEQVEKRLLVLEGNQLKTTETGRWVLNKVVAAFLEG